MLFNSRSTDHGRGPQSYRGRADIFAVCFPPGEQVYLVPIDGVAEFEGRLRLEPTRNNQSKGIRFAAQYELERWTVDDLRAILRRGTEGARTGDSRRLLLGRVA